MIQTTVVGSYPKPPDEGRPFALRRALHALERGEAREEDVRAAEDALVAEVIAEQERAGVDIVTDGQVRWDDLLTPFARAMAGFEIGGLIRFFDNNVYYRRPVCVADVEWRGPASVEEFSFARAVASRPVKAVIPGPLTFALLSLDEHYGDHERFVLAVARVLAQEAFELEAAGASFIQIDEPALLNAPEELPLAKRALQIVTGEVKEAEITLATYFGSVKRLGLELFDLPVQWWALDLISGSDDYELIEAAPSQVCIQAGIVDARNTKLEAADDLAPDIERLRRHLAEARLRTSPSAGLEFLPREKARSKLERLCEATRKVGV